MKRANPDTDSRTTRERPAQRNRNWPPLGESTVVALDPARWSTRDRQIAFWCLCETWLALETVH